MDNIKIGQPQEDVQSTIQQAWPGLLMVAIASLVYYHLKMFSFWSSRGIQGPQPWPILGTSIYYFFKSKVEVDMEWRNRYGRTYGIYEGYSPVLRTTDNEILKHIYIKQFNSFTDRNHHVIHSKRQRQWIFFTEGQYWANQRALVSPMFTSSKMRLMATKMSECIDRFMDEVSRRIQETKSRQSMSVDGGQSGDQVAEEKLMLKAAEKTTFARDDVMALTLDVIAQSFFSIKINTYRDKANKFLANAYNFARFEFSRFLIWTLLPKRLARLLQYDLFAQDRFEYFDKLGMSMIKERRRQAPTATGHKPSKVDMIQQLIEAKIPERYKKIYSKEDDKESHYNDQLSHEELEKIQRSQSQASKMFREFSDEEINGAVTFFLIAGFETTASSISFCLYELAHQPAAQQEVYEELCQKIGHHKDKSTIDYSDLLDLKKLDGLVSEVLRLYSPILENNRLVVDPEGAVIPTKPHPIHLPKNISISTNLYVLQRDEEYFDKVNDFQLNRFYPENRDKIKSCTYAPFGLGPRACAGTRFALLEIKLCLAKLLLKHIVEPGERSASYPPEYKQNAVFLQFESTDFKLIPRTRL